MNKHQKATRQVLDHVKRACQELDEFLKEGVNVETVFMRPQLQAAKLKLAREELIKATAIMDRTKW